MEFKKIANPIVTGMTAGWVAENGERHYFFGAGVHTDYTAEVPEGLGYQVLRPVKKLKNN